MRRFKVYVILFNGNRVHLKCVMVYNENGGFSYAKESKTLFEYRDVENVTSRVLNVYKVYKCLCKRLTKCVFAGNGPRVQNVSFQQPRVICIQRYVHTIVSVRKSKRTRNINTVTMVLKLRYICLNNIIVCMACN